MGRSFAVTGPTDGLPATRSSQPSVAGTVATLRVGQTLRHGTGAGCRAVRSAPDQPAGRDPRLPADRLAADFADLLDAESADRVSRHVAALLARAMDAAPERERTTEGVRLATALLNELQALAGLRIDDEVPHPSGRVLHAVLRRRPDGTPDPIERPLTPLLDTTVLTNAPGEPAVAYELRAEVPSADAVDVVMAFIRFSGVRSLIDVLRRHCREGRLSRTLWLGCCPG